MGVGSYMYMYTRETGAGGTRVNLLYFASWRWELWFDQMAG